MTPAAPPPTSDHARQGPRPADEQSGRAATCAVRSLSDVASVQEKLLAQVRERGYDESAQFAIRLAVEEALVNAVRHGEPARRDEPVRVLYEVTEESVKVRIIDPGPGFDPKKVPDPTSDDRLDLPTGRGILLMRAFMTHVVFNEKGNEVTLIYERSKPG